MWDSKRLTVLDLLGFFAGVEYVYEEEVSPELSFFDFLCFLGFGSLGSWLVKLILWSAGGKGFLLYLRSWSIFARLHVVIERVLGFRSLLLFFPFLPLLLFLPCLFGGFPGFFGEG